MRRILVGVALLLASSVFAADPLPRAKPESIGMSSARLERIGTALKADVEKGRIPARWLQSRARVARTTRPWAGATRRTRAPMTKDAIFSIASMTATMTSVAVLHSMRRAGC